MKFLIISDYLIPLQHTDLTINQSIKCNIYICKIVLINYTNQSFGGLFALSLFGQLVFFFVSQSSLAPRNESHIHNTFLVCFERHLGVPGWPSWLSVQLQILAQVMISQFVGSSLRRTLRGQHKAYLESSLALSLFPSPALCFSKKKKINHNKILKGI